MKRDYWKPLLKLQLAKQPLLTFAPGLDGAKLASLIGVPLSPERAMDSDWRLAVETQEQLDSLVDGALAVLHHQGTFPDFSEWRKRVLTGGL